MLTSEDKAKLSDLIAKWQWNPIDFFYEALRLRARGVTLTSQQEEATKELTYLIRAKLKKIRGDKLTKQEKEYARKTGISIRSGHGTGKDAWTSWVILYFMFCFEMLKGFATAPTSRQLQSILWAEIAKWLKGDPTDTKTWPIIKPFFVWQQKKLFMKGHHEQWFIVAQTAGKTVQNKDEGGTMAGFHGDHLLLIAEEASDVDEAVFKPFEATMTGPVNIGIIIFNPIRRTGYAAKTHLDEKSGEQWINLHWDSELSENVDSDYIEKMQRKYGVDSPYYITRVKGNFASQEDDGLIPYEWVMAAVDDTLEYGYITDEYTMHLPRVLSVDVGAGGDPSIILHRIGNVVVRIKKSNTKDTMELVRQVCDEYTIYVCSVIYVDSIGIGYGVKDRLTELLGRKNVIPVNVSHAARNTNRFCFLRDELWYNLRDKFEEGSLKIPNDEELIGELSSIRYEERRGKVKIIGKKEMLAMGYPSPNIGDALMQSFFWPDTMFAKECNYNMFPAPIHISETHEQGWMFL